MKEQAEIKLPKIGYLYHYPRLDRSTGNFRLDIFVSSVPTEQHFDVQHAHFFIITPEETTERLSISHPWSYKKDAQVCAGVVVMEDRHKEKKEAFTFGGNLTIESYKTHTLCSIVSSAPILELSDSTPLLQFFIEELEIILAERRALYPKLHDYEKQLANADSLTLYLASLEELIEKFEEFPNKDKRYREFLIFLHAEKHRLYEAGISTELAPTLDEIFKTGTK